MEGSSGPFHDGRVSLPESRREVTRFSYKSICWYALFNSPPQNDRHIPDDILKCSFVTEKFCILKISLKFVPMGPFDNEPALVQKMAWCQGGDGPLPEPMPLSSVTHICGTRGSWVKMAINFLTVTPTLCRIFNLPSIQFYEVWQSVHQANYFTTVGVK